MPITTRRAWGAAASLIIALVPMLMTASADASSLDIPNYTHASDTSDWNSNNKGAEATCPTGTHVLGAGAWVGGESGDIVIDEVIPSADKVKVFGVEGNSTRNSWTITAWAVCGTVHGAVRTRSLETSRYSPPWNSLTVNCEPGEVLLGTGYELDGANGAVRMDWLIPTLPGAAPASVDRTASERATTYNSDWSLRVYAICAEEPPAGYWIYSETSPSSAEPKRVEASCALDRQVVLGSGFAIDIADDGVRAGIVLDAYYSINTLTRVETAEIHGDDNEWTATAYAICAYED